MKADLVSGLLPVREDGRVLVLQRPTGTWEPPAGRLQRGEGFEEGAVRELYEETGVRAEVEEAWWARVEPWRGPEDTELYAGVGFLAPHPGGDVRIEGTAHDDYVWATEREWRSLPTWYTGQELDALWDAVRMLEA